MLTKLRGLLRNHEFLIIEANKDEWVNIQEWLEYNRDDDSESEDSAIECTALYQGSEIRLLRYEDESKLRLRGAKWKGKRPTAAILKREGKIPPTVVYALHPLREEIAFV